MQLQAIAIDSAKVVPDVSFPRDAIKSPKIRPKVLNGMTAVN